MEIHRFQLTESLFQEVRGFCASLTIVEDLVCLLKRDLDNLFPFFACRRGSGQSASTLCRWRQCRCEILESGGQIFGSHILTFCRRRHCRPFIRSRQKFSNYFRIGTETICLPGLHAPNIVKCGAVRHHDEKMPQKGFPVRIPIVLALEILNFYKMLILSPNLSPVLFTSFLEQVILSGPLNESQVLVH